MTRNWVLIFYTYVLKRNRPIVTINVVAYVTNTLVTTLISRK